MYVCVYREYTRLQPRSAMTNNSKMRCCQLLFLLLLCSVPVADLSKSTHTRTQTCAHARIHGHSQRVSANETGLAVVQRRAREQANEQAR